MVSGDPGGRRLESTENLSFTSRTHDSDGYANDSNGYCWPSPGLGNTAGAEIPEGDVWGALKSTQYVAWERIRRLLLALSGALVCVYVCVWLCVCLCMCVYVYVCSVYMCIYVCMLCMCVLCVWRVFSLEVSKNHTGRRQ